MSHPAALSATNPQRRPALCGSILSPALSVAVGAMLCLASASTWARPPWLCSLADEATRLVCVVDQEATSDLGAAFDAAITSARAQTAAAQVTSGAGKVATPATTPPAGTDATAPAPSTVNGTAFPLDMARVYTVELFAPATERDWVEQLARATICYRSPGCEVIVVGMDDPASAAAPARSSNTVARLTRPGS